MRLEWQLDQLKDHHVSGLQINYAHSDQGGDSYGLTIESDPPLFSEAWWELFAWFAEKASTYGIAVSLSDYRLCSPGQGWFTDEILAKKPEMAGSNLVYTEWKVEDGRIERQLPPNTIIVSAYRSPMQSEKQDGLVDLAPYVQGSILQWNKPEGLWNIAIVHAEVKQRSIDPMHPDSGAMVLEHFFQRFEDRMSGIAGAKLVFFSPMNWNSVSRGGYGTTGSGMSLREGKVTILFPNWQRCLPISVHVHPKSGSITAM